MNHFQSNGPDVEIFKICIYNIFKIFMMYILNSFGPKNGGFSFQPSRKIIK